MPRIVIPTIKGMHRAVPPGMSIQEDGAFASLLNNLRPNYGAIGRRPGTSQVSGMPTLDTVIGATQTDFTIVYAEEIDIEPGIQTRWIVFTEREVFLGRPGSTWSNVCPVHNDATVDVTNGSTTVTGNATSWIVRGIKPQDYFKGPDGSYYEIASVDSSSEITLQSAYQGSTLSTQSYEIRRTADFLGVHPRPFVVNLQGDLYYAGGISGGPQQTGGAQIADGGVVKIDQGAYLNKTSWTASSDVSFLLSGISAVESGIDSMGDIIVIYGFGKLSDGRLVIAHHAYDLNNDFAANRRFSYSSPTDLTTWTTSPGGSTDIEEFNGSITAAVFYTNTVSFHLTDGIAIGELTGRADRPLRVRPSRSTVGAIGPHMVTKTTGGAAVRGREAFIGSDLALYSFNGGDSTPIKGAAFELEIVSSLNQGPDQHLEIREGFCFEDRRRSELAFSFYFDEGSPASSFGKKTREVRISTETGLLWRAQYAGEARWAFVPIRTESDGGTPWEGSRPLDELTLFTSTGDGWAYKLSEFNTTDDLDQSESNTNGILCLIEDIDGGTPWTKNTLKECLVFFRGTRQFPTVSVGDSLNLSWNGDSGLTPANSTEASGRNTEYKGQTEGVARFHPLTQGSYTNLWIRLESPDDDTFNLEVTRIVIDYEATADVRSV